MISTAARAATTWTAVVGNDTATGGGGDDVVRGGANDDNLRGDFPFIGHYDAISTYLKVGDTGTPAQPDEYFAYQGYVTGRDQVYGEAGSEHLFGDGGASDPIVVQRHGSVGQNHRQDPQSGQGISGLYLHLRRGQQRP